MIHLIGVCWLNKYNEYSSAAGIAALVQGRVAREKRLPTTKSSGSERCDKMEFTDILLYGGIGAVVLYAASQYFGSKSPKVAQVPYVRRQSPEKRDYTREELKKYDGSDKTSPILLAVKGIIYDVSARSEFYGPGGAYSAFSGKDASRALAKGSTEPEVAADPNVDDLTADEKANLEEWASHYAMKYEVVGKVIQ